MLAFKLDGEPHFLTGIASAHIGGSASNLAFGEGCAQTLNVGCGFWLDRVTLTPGMKFLIGEPSHSSFPLSRALLWRLGRDAPAVRLPARACGKYTREHEKRQ